MFPTLNFEQLVINFTNIFEYFRYIYQLEYWPGSA